MMDPKWITVCTVFGGSIIAAISYFITWRRVGRWQVPFELWIGYLLNSLTLATLAGFTYNICFAVLYAAITDRPMDGLAIEGNEALIFWVFVYSLGQAALSLRRAVLSVVP